MSQYPVAGREGAAFCANGESHLSHGKCMTRSAGENAFSASVGACNDVDHCAFVKGKIIGYQLALCLQSDNRVYKALCIEEIFFCNDVGVQRVTPLSLSLEISLVPSITNSISGAILRRKSVLSRT